VGITGQYVSVTFAVRRDVLEKLKKINPQYGERSKILRKLIQLYVEGRIYLVDDRRKQ
jgi:hypothetical protein